MNNQKYSVKAQIASATAKLLREKSYLDITVSDIVNEAGVARVSFYRNYGSIADVFDDIAGEAFSEITNEIMPVLEGKDKRKWKELLYNMFYHFPKHHSLNLEKRQENINLLFSRMMLKLQETEALKSPENLGEKYLSFGKLGLIVNIIKKWMADGQKEEPEDMVNFIMTFITEF